MKIVAKTKQDLLKQINTLNDNMFKEPVVVLISDIEEYKTDKQNKTFHALLYAFFESGYSSFDQIIDLKNHYKNEMGLGVDYYIYFLERDLLSKGNNPKLYKIDKLNKLPKDARGLHKIFKSFSLATKKQVLIGIEALKRDIYLSGASIDPKIQKILVGLGDIVEDNQIDLKDSVRYFFADAKQK